MTLLSNVLVDETVNLTVEALVLSLLLQLRPCTDNDDSDKASSPQTIMPQLSLAIRSLYSVIR